jgi:hypothetical protein
MNLNPLSISALAAVGCGLAVAACGSSASHSSQSAAIAQNAQRPLAFSQCMRAHGVPKFPDPAGGRIQIGPGTGINPASPAFQAAQKACGGLGKGGPGGGNPTEADKLAMLDVSKCMRVHGLPNFPDPTTHPPTPGNGVNAVIGRNGVFLVLGSGIDPRSPAFEHAAAVCGLLRGK